MYHQAMYFAVLYFFLIIADIGSMLVLLDPSALSPALLSSAKSLIQQPKAEFTLVDPVVSQKLF
jgi:hypothetical protein